MILVAGGSGFVGSAIVRELVRRGKPVAVLTRDPEKARGSFPGLEVELRRGDVRDESTLSRAMEGVDAVIGSQTFPNLPIEDPTRGNTFDQIDARGTERLVQAGRGAGLLRYVYISGAGASAESPYHWHRAKWRAEMAVRGSGMTWTILRPSWIYGPQDKALNRFLRMSRFLPFLPLIGNPSRQRLQPVFADDVALAVAESLDNPAAAGQTFEIGGPEVFSMLAIVRTALQVTGRRRMIVAAPAGLVKVVASALQHLPGRPLTPDAVEFITMDALADPSEIENALAIKMTPLREALGTYLSR